MFKLLIISMALLSATSFSLGQQSPASSPAVSQETRDLLHRMGSRNIGVHDPSTLIKCKDEYWIFTTGAGTPSIHSKDLITWTRGPATFPQAPAWVHEAIPAFRGNGFWAPDCIHVGNQYLLFYSASTFGKNGSAIGVATNPTLDPADPAYHWTDGGMVVKSTDNDDFNAIDPCPLLDSDGKLWMSFGSFWSGIKLIELNPATGLRVAANSPMHSLAHFDSIEASYIYKHDGYYYLFVSLGMCCRGANSTYNTRIGRSQNITGPYLDKAGHDLLDDGGTLFIGSEGAFNGPGQAGVMEESGKFYLTCHFYDLSARGASKLAIRPLTWQADGWPVVGTVE